MNKSYVQTNFNIWKLLLLPFTKLKLKLSRTKIQISLPQVLVQHTGHDTIF